MSYSVIDETNAMHLVDLIQRAQSWGALNQVSPIAFATQGFAEWREPVALSAEVIDEQSSISQYVAVSQLEHMGHRPVGLVELLRFAILGVDGEPGFWDGHSRVVALGELHRPSGNSYTWAPTIDQICLGRDHVSGRLRWTRRLHFRRLTTVRDLWPDRTQFLVQA